MSHTSLAAPHWFDPDLAAAALAQEGQSLPRAGVHAAVTFDTASGTVEVDKCSSTWAWVGGIVLGAIGGAGAMYFVSDASKRKAEEKAAAAAGRAWDRTKQVTSGAAQGAREGWNR